MLLCCLFVLSKILAVPPSVMALRWVRGARTCSKKRDPEPGPKEGFFFSLPQPGRCGPREPFVCQTGQITTITHGQDWLGYRGTFIAGNAVKGQHRPHEQTGSGWCKPSPCAAEGAGWGAWGAERSPLSPLLMPARGGGERIPHRSWGGCGSQGCHC